MRERERERERERAGEREREYCGRYFLFSIWYIEHRLRTRYIEVILIIKSEIHLLYSNSGYLELGFI